MLDVLRRNAGSWAIKGILTFIALTFIWWGVGSYSQSKQDVAATVGDGKISMAELAEAHAGLEKTYRDVYGKEFTPEVAKALNLRRQALETLVRRRLLLAEAARMGLPQPTRRSGGRSRRRPRSRWTGRSARTGTGASSPTTGSPRGVRGFQARGDHAPKDRGSPLLLRPGPRGEARDLFNLTCGRSGCSWSRPIPRRENRSRPRRRARSRQSTSRPRKATGSPPG